MIEWSTFGSALSAIVIAIFSAEWIFISWLSRQFSKVYTKMDQLAEKILSKLEYHEKHDDQRFEDVRNNLWELRVSNAARDAKWLDRRPQSFQKNVNSEETLQNPL